VHDTQAQGISDSQAFVKPNGLSIVRGPVIRRGIRSGAGLSRPQVVSSSLIRQAVTPPSARGEGGTHAGMWKGQA